ncbi:hypothetical protein [Aquimarina longa]|uniref:hypothetical protein n=1 Tax=Aquimarina longa TaxID=1080221 RepID=UPI0007861A74|nr:hypothetical protein [Aquimarina longa]
MASDNNNPISSVLSTLLKESLSTSQLRAIAKKYDVHYNTIINIRDRKKKSPDKTILKEMIETAINTQKDQIKKGKNLLMLLQKEFTKLIQHP